MTNNEKRKISESLAGTRKVSLVERMPRNPWKSNDYLALAPRVGAASK